MFRYASACLLAIAPVPRIPTFIILERTFLLRAPLQYDKKVCWRARRPHFPKALRNPESTIFVEQRSLAERLQPRIEVEKRFAATGRKLRKKSFLFRHEKIFIRPLLKLGLQITGLYPVGVKNALSPVIRHVDMHFVDLPVALDGFEILHLSDLHIDGVDGLTEKLTPILRTLHPHLCVFTGDYRFEDRGPCEEVYPRMRAIFSSISAKHGTFAILGNHDSSEIAFRLEDLGVRMLVNEAVEIGQGSASLWLGGIDDPFDYRCDDLPGTLAPIPRDAFKVLLAHTPELYSHASGHSVHVYLSGHTHAGQIRFPIIGSLRNNADCPAQYCWGHWSHRQMQGYTSAGVGCSTLPIRFNCPPELVLIKLRRGSRL